MILEQKKLMVWGEWLL